MEIRSPKGRKFASLAQMEAEIKKQLDEVAEKVLTEVAEEVRLKMEELILEFYSEYRPKSDEEGNPLYYNRTGGLLDAVRNTQSKVYKTKNGYRVRIKLFDTDQIDQQFAEKPYFNSYLDFSGHATYGGKRYTDWVVEWVDSGGIIGHDGLNYQQEINDLLDRKVNEGILTEMRRAGFSKR